MMKEQMNELQRVIEEQMMEKMELEQRLNSK